MALELTKDTRLCISLSARPSNIGTRFHNYLYTELGLDYVYKAFTTNDIAAAIGGVRALGIRGCGVSMPWKEEVIPLVDAMDPSAKAIRSVNTIVNDDGRLTAYNTDLIAVRTLLSQAQVPIDGEVAVLGSGGMAKACVAALRQHGVADGLVVARNERTGRELASGHGWTWLAQLGEHRPAVVVNATPVGMAGGPGEDELPVDDDVVCRARTILDVVAVPSHTPLVLRAQQLGVPVISGDQVIALQAAEQFALYTGVRPSAEQVRRASDYSRA